MRTLWMAARFRWEVNQLAESVLPELERARPDLVIADFEPIVPRAARRLGLPFVSFDHQHYLVVSDFSALPFWIRQEANLAAPFVRALYDWQQATIVSAFYRAPLKPAYGDTTWVATLIRPEMVPIRPIHGRSLVAYVRRYASPETLSALAASGREVRIYGLGARADVEHWAERVEMRVGGRAPDAGRLRLWPARRQRAPAQPQLLGLVALADLHGRPGAPRDRHAQLPRRARLRPLPAPGRRTGGSGSGGAGPGEPGRRADRDRGSARRRRPPALPPLEPLGPAATLDLPPLSVAFVILPRATAPACR